MPTVRLGRDQVLTLDGVALEGTRDIDLDIDMDTHDITSWDHAWKSTLPVVGDATARLLIYWKDNYDKFSDKLNEHPPVPMTLALTNAFSFGCVPVKVGVKCPIAGVLAWDVTLKLYTYQ